MEFKYKGWFVSVEKDPFIGYYKWYANGPNDETLSDNEGGELCDMKNAKLEIKRLIDEYIRQPFLFRIRYPGLVGR